MGDISQQIKEIEGKIDYSEIDWEFIDGMALRMNANKNKYPKNNTDNMTESDIRLLEQATFRHLRKMLQPVEDDPESYTDHMFAIADNLMMIYQVLKSY